MVVFHKRQSQTAHLFTVFLKEICQLAIIACCQQQAVSVVYVTRLHFFGNLKYTGVILNDRVSVDILYKEPAHKSIVTVKELIVEEDAKNKHYKQRIYGRKYRHRIVITRYIL